MIHYLISTHDPYLNVLKQWLMYLMVVDLPSYDEHVNQVDALINKWVRGI